MIPTQINRNSWHFRLASVYGGGVEWMMGDTCSYISKVFRGMFMASFWAGLIGSAIAGVYSFIFWSITIGCLVAISDPPSLFFMLGTLIVAFAAIIAVLVAFCFLGEIYSDWRHKNRKLRGKGKPSTPSFYSIAKTRLADKVCIEVEYK